MANLIEFFTPLFLRGLRLDADLAGGGGQVAAFSATLDDLITDIEQTKRGAAEAAKPAVDVEEAVFAVVAWLDEMMAKYPGWSGRDTRGQETLQKRLFNIGVAGNQFFEHLTKLSRQQDETREIYYVALCLGFTGQYYYESGEEGDLGRIRENLSRQLPQPAVSLPALADERITPQPYSVPDPGPARVPGRSGNLLLKATIAAAILIPLIAFVLWIRKPPPPPPPLLPQVEQKLSTFQCAALQSTVDETARTIVVKGRVESTLEHTRLQQELAGLPGVKNVDAQGVGVLPRPFCAVVELLDPYVANAQAKQLGLAVAPSRHTTQYHEGEDLILDVQAPSTDAYVYVDYFQKDGHVVHLLPNPLEKRNLLTKSSISTIGEGRTDPGKRFWTVLPPLGTELISIVSFPRPLFVQDRPEAEDAAAYLEAMRNAFSQAGEAEPLAASYFFIETRPKQ